MRNTIMTLLLVLAVVLPVQDLAAQALQPVGQAYYPIKIIKFNASYPAKQQPKPESIQIGKMSNALHTDTTEWVAVPVSIMLTTAPSDTIPRLGIAMKTNIDTLSAKITAQYGFAGSAPDSSVANAGAFVAATGLPADSYSIQRETTVTYDVADFARLRTNSMPFGATHVRFFISWEAAGQSIESDGNDTDRWQLYLVWPEQLE